MATTSWQRLHEAVEYWDLEAAESICERGEINIDEREEDDGGDTALLIACRKGYSSMVRLLLEYNASMSIADAFGNTPFQIACGEGYARIVKTFLRAGADPNEQTRAGRDAPLHYANTPKVVQVLLDHGADVSLQGDQGRTPVIGKTNKEALRLILEHNGDPNSESWTRVTPLHEACQMGCLPVVRLLLERGANPDALDNLQRGPFHYACRWGDIMEMVVLLKQYGASPTWRDIRGRTPLHEACIGNHIEVSQWLVGLGCHPNDRDLNGQTALHFTTQCDDFCADSRPLINWLVTKDPSLVHAVDNMQRTALHTCCSVPGGFLSQRPELLVDLVTKGSCVNAKDTLGKTALHLACLFNMPQHVVALVRHGIDVNAKDASGWTGLHYAVYKGLDEVVKILLASGAQVNATNSQGRTPMHLVGVSSTRGVYEGREDEFITATLEAPARVEEKAGLYEKLMDLEKDIDQSSRSHTLLLSHGADATAHDSKGNLPFFLASTGCLLNEVFGMIRVAASQGLFRSDHQRVASPLPPVAAARKRRRPAFARQDEGDSKTPRC